MKTLIALILIILITNSCSRLRNDSSHLEADLEKIEESISSSVADKLVYAEIEHIINEEKWGITHQKLRSIATLYDHLVKKVHSEELSPNVVKQIVVDFNKTVKRLELDNQHLTDKIEDKLSYWTSIESNQFYRNILAIDIRLCVLDIIDELVNQVEISDVNFNVLEPVIIESSNTVAAGEVYKAKIGVIGYDSTMLPIIKIDGFELEFRDGFGLYRATSNKPGLKTFQGEIQLNNHGSVISRKFEASYIVE